MAGFAHSPAAHVQEAARDGHLLAVHQDMLDIALHLRERDREGETRSKGQGCRGEIMHRHIYIYAYTQTQAQAQAHRCPQASITTAQNSSSCRICAAMICEDSTWGSTESFTVL